MPKAQHFGKPSPHFPAPLPKRGKKKGKKFKLGNHYWNPNNRFFSFLENQKRLAPVSPMTKNVICARVIRFEKSYTKSENLFFEKR